MVASSPTGRILVTSSSPTNLRQVPQAVKLCQLAVASGSGMWTCRKLRRPVGQAPSTGSFLNMHLTLFRLRVLSEVAGTAPAHALAALPTVLQLLVVAGAVLLVLQCQRLDRCPGVEMVLLALRLGPLLQRSQAACLMIRGSFLSVFRDHRRYGTAELRRCMPHHCSPQRFIKRTQSAVQCTGSSLTFPVSPCFCEVFQIFLQGRGPRAQPLLTGAPVIKARWWTHSEQRLTN